MFPNSLGEITKKGNILKVYQGSKWNRVSLAEYQIFFLLFEIQT